MDNLARKMKRVEGALQAGTVVAVEGSTAQVIAAGRRISAERAASCLLQPEVADRVLLVELDDARTYVLSVLVRGQTHRASLVHEGDLELKLPSGKLSVATQEGIGLVTAGAISFVARAFRVNAVEAALSVDRTTFLGGLLEAELEGVKLLSRTFDSVLERVSQHVKRSFRRVEELDSVRAGQLDYCANKNARLHGQNTVVTAERLVKLDGEQVHVG